MQADNRGHLDIFDNIDDKAFLGNRNLISVNINCSSVGNWAFAHCKRLRTVNISRSDISIGRDAFLGCDSLESLKIGDGSNEYLIPIALRLLKKAGIVEAPGLEWYKKIDEYICSYLQEPDDKGFEGLWTFGEEDYVEDAFDRDFFIKSVRMDKCRLVLERVGCGNLSEDTECIYKSYLLDNMGDHNSWGPCYAVINSEGKRISSYIEILKQYGIIDAINIPLLLRDLNNIGVEARAVLIKSDTTNNDDSSLQKIDSFFDLL